MFGTKIKKRGAFFSTDALVALIIIFSVVLIAYPIKKEAVSETEIHYDLLNTLSSLKVGESQIPYVQNLIADGTIVNLNNSLLEQAGEFYSTDTAQARDFLNSVVSEIDTNRNFGIWFGNSLIYVNNASSIEEAKKVDTARQVISGIKEGEGIFGFSARAFLLSNLQTKYFYFGGYVGDGNISTIVNYSGNISSAEIEVAINKGFDLYVNGNYLGNYPESPSDFTPAKYNISTEFFNSGENLFEINGDGIYIAGGFLKIIYRSEVEFSQTERYNFPGIEGAINLYDGFYVPGNLTNLEILLHINNSFTPTFLNIGNVTVFENVTNDEETILITDSELSSMFDYGALSERTIPLRLGIKNSSAFNQTGKADVFSVTDLSGSMNACAEYSLPFICNYNCTDGNQRSCQVNDPSECTGNVCGGTCPGPFGHYLSCDATSLDLAKEANNVFIDVLLNSSENRVGLVGYISYVPPFRYHELSQDDVSLKNSVAAWTANGGTCICCGVNKAVEGMLNDSDNETSKSMVVMSDGVANNQCAQQGTGTPQGDSIQSACDAYENNITVYTIGFGPGVDETTLQAMADCGNGAYYYSNIDELSEIYQQIAEIIIAKYTQQTIEISEGVYTSLYPDSYILFSYDSLRPSYGLVLTLEKLFDDADSGSFSVPDDASFIETKIASYSGPRWTGEVTINDLEVYNLDNYGEEYTYLGDPYFINVPSYIPIPGQTNVVNLTTGVSPLNKTGGSSSNKIIYTVARNVSAFSPILSTAQGCNWRIQFEDDSEIEVIIPENYSDGNQCTYLEGSTGEVANENDAYEIAVRNLLRDLDFDSNGKIDVKFSEQELKVSTDEVVGIPFTWATEVQIRTWV
ncbi:VWA domain-containing protein [Candidatus Pacearchaeota archaeon]|nr:VWA domain-containing protein [Candidatus Pacearchaeota archaeon]